MYNVEKYVGCAIQSLLDQTFTDFEAILVDDCSTDNTLAVAKRFNDPRIKIFANERNSGAAETRNIGMSHARGKYIYFFDSDDALLPNALQLLITAAEKNNADVVSSLVHLEALGDNEFQDIRGGGINFKLCPRGPLRAISSDLKTRFIEEYCSAQIPVTNCFNMHRRKFLENNKIKFKAFTAGEDHLFMMEILCRAKTMIKIDKPFYIYRQRKGSLSRPLSTNFDSFPKRIRDILYIPTFCEKLLSKAMHDNSIPKDELLIYVVGMKCMEFIMEVNILPFYQADPNKTLRIINDELKSMFNQNSKTVTTILYGFILKNLQCKSAIQENFMLKYQINEIKKKQI